MKTTMAPLTNLPHGDWLSIRAALTPSKVALLDATCLRPPPTKVAPLRPEEPLTSALSLRPITYKAWDRRASAAARYLRDRLGIKRGDRVAICSNNRVEYLDLLFAVGKLGAVLVCLNTRLAPVELSQIVKQAAPAVVFYDGKLPAHVEALRKLGIQVAALFETLAPEDPSLLDAALEHAEVDGGSLAGVYVHPEDPWVICYTGGSTGLPKGALLTHRSILANAEGTCKGWGLIESDVAILDAPLFHTGGLNVFTTPLVYAGGTSIVCSKFDPGQTFELIKSAGVTLYFGVPTMHLLLQAHEQFASVDLKGLRILISGGAPCPLPVFQRYFEKGVPFKTGYGLTEAGPNNFWLADEMVQKKPGSIGKPLPHVSARIVRKTEEPVAEFVDCEPGEIGELILDGDHVFSGYLGHPPHSGYLQTGDLAKRDQDGDYSICGRHKEMYISGGENVYPAEIEGVLYGHPEVLEAAVVGFPDPLWGEVGHAFVVPKHPGQLSKDRLFADLRTQLAGYKVPKMIHFLQELPKTGAGKINKVALRQLPVSS